MFGLDNSARLRRIREERRAQQVAEVRRLFDRSRGIGQDRIVEVAVEFQWLSPDQKALLLRECPSFYMAAARLAEVYSVARRNGTKP